MRKHIPMLAGVASCAIAAPIAVAEAASGPETPVAGAAPVGALATPGPLAQPLAAAPKVRAATPRRVTVRASRLAVGEGRRVFVRGSVAPNRGGLPVALQIQRAGAWRTIDSTRTRASGAYRLADRRSTSDSTRARVRVRRGDGRTLTRRLGRLEVFRGAYASWYGPGLFGNQLGCGGRLGTGTLGVAHKALPCGTKVTLRHAGRSVRVPVIDRGPYVAGREFDLTAATAQRLGFSGHGRIGVAQ